MFTRGLVTKSLRDTISYSKNVKVKDGLTVKKLFIFLINDLTHEPTTSL